MRRPRLAQWLTVLVCAAAWGDLIGLCDCVTGRASAQEFRHPLWVAFNDPTEPDFIQISHHLQDVPPLTPQLMQPDTARLPQRPDAMTSASLFRGGAPRSNLPSTLASSNSSSSADRVLGIEAPTRSTTDGGSLLGKSAANRSVTTQKRNPIITDPRIRGSRVGQLNASGSYWIPARIDLDTMLSKIDSRLIEQVTVVKGPYAARYGPGFDFIDFELAHSPRSEDDLQFGGSTSGNYMSNGEQWYGRQMFQAADEDWGLRVGYGHRGGSDYQSGNGAEIPASYKSRDIDLTFGWDFEPGRSVEFSYLRLDQTDVELPGQAFDLDFLVTDGFEVTVIDETVLWADRFETEAWYNQTRLGGNAQSPSKRQTFPFMNFIDYVGRTNVNSQSAGARLEATWELSPDRIATGGADVRVVRQQIDEISSGRFGASTFTDVNSPLPQSVAANPGLFMEFVDRSLEGLTVRTGARADLVAAEVTEDAANLAALGTGTPQSSLADILGTGDFDQSFGLWSAYLTAEYAVDEHWTLYGNAGHGQRAPSLTELYVAESFMFLLQNGLNTVTGDPRLKPERRWQIDLGLGYDEGPFSARVNGFHAWVNDAITFENLSIRRGPPAGQVEQINLKYVNTDLATFVGVEANAEYQLTDSIELFAMLGYVQGTDLTRNGHFATEQATPGNPSQRDPTRPRGDFSGVPQAGDHEPLPQIPPLWSRLGARFQTQLAGRPWHVELSTRLVAEQDRVATSLLESTTPGFAVWDLRTAWRPRERVTVLAGVENFTNENYREHFDFRSQNPLARPVLQPGVNFYLGTEVAY